MPKGSATWRPLPSWSVLDRLRVTRTPWSLSLRSPEGDELGSAQGPGEPDQQEGAVAGADGRVGQVGDHPADVADGGGGQFRREDGRRCR